jgi:hypothetical protein
MAASSTATARRAAAPARTRRPRARPAPRSATRTARSPRRQPLAPMPARLVPLTVGRTAGAVSGLADSGLVHRLTRGRLWIGALTTLLVGIVALNVLALSFNASSSRVGRQADSLKREISALRAQIATDGSSNQRIQAAAARLGLIVPEPGSVGYLRPGHDDAAVAARRLVSGDLTTETVSVVAPLAPAIVPAAAPTTDPATDQVAVAPATETAPATDATATTTTTETTSPAGGQGADGASGGGGGVAAP